MKKFILFFLMAVAFIFSANAQQWVKFSSSVPKAPEINLITSDSIAVTFEVTLPGIYTLDTVVNGTAFKRLHLPGGGAINPAGEPELPLLAYKVAIPYCDEVEVAYQIRSRQTMPSCWVYPKPEMVLDGNGNLVEQFAFNPTAYTIPRFNDPAAIISSTGTLRSQRYVEVTVYPIEFCPVKQQLSVIDQIEITLTFTNQQGDLRQNTGIFNKVAASTFINYEDNGISALENDKAYQKAGFKRGNVNWIDITDTAQAATIVADYLIITVPKFFNPRNADLQRLAEHRSFYNGYDVAIVNVAHIIADSVGFEYVINPNWWENDPDKYKDEQRIRNFVKRVFEGKNAHNSHNSYGDGCLAFVLLVGDYDDVNGGIPGATEHGINNSPYSIYAMLSDYYYSCITKDPITGKFDHSGDLYIGRFSVETDIHLFNMVQKTINHETNFSDTSWRKKAGFSNAWNLEGWNGYNTIYFNFASNLMSNCGWSHTAVDGWVLPNHDISIPTINYLNAGVSFMQYVGLCFDPSALEGNLNINLVSNELTNEYMTPFINAVSSTIASFDNKECFGEFITRYDSIRGAVGCIGAIRPISLPLHLTLDNYQEKFLKFLFKDSIPISIAGELLLTTKDQFPNFGEWEMNCKYSYALLGDPALNILAEPTEGCRMYVSNQMQLLNGQSMYVPDDCILYFHPQGKLTVEDGGALVLGNRVQVIGLNNQIDSVIHVKGGGFTVGEDVVFQDLPGGILMENYSEKGEPPIFDVTKKYFLEHITFNNTPLTHRDTRLQIFDCTFNPGSNVKSELGICRIWDCTFNNTVVLANHSISPRLWKQYKVPSDTGHIVVRDSRFYGSNVNTAIKLICTNEHDIQDNTISGYETGISLTTSGNEKYLTTNMLFTNEISNCYTGVELYNSRSMICRNNIHDNAYGVKLFNNSYTLFDNSSYESQIIQNCDSIEIYASANSFPTIFQYNQISDVSNQGNSSDIPLCWWDVEPPYPDAHKVYYNCWGNNFKPQYDLYPSEALYWDPVWDCTGKSASPPRGADETIFRSGLEYFANEDYPNAETTFKNLIETYPESRFALAALHELFALEHFTDNDFYKLYGYYTTFSSSDSNLFETADFLATRCHVKERNWQPAINWYENRIENPPSYQDSIFAVIDLGNIHFLMENDTVGENGSKSNRCYYRLEKVKPESRQKYEENKATLLATLPQMKQSETEKSQNQTLYKNKKGVLGECVPNPTNGNTTIFYEIYTKGIAEIHIYNALGQIVKSVVQKNSVAGNYQAKISFSGVPAGLYHYTLWVNGERTDTKRVVVK